MSSLTNLCEGRKNVEKLINSVYIYSNMELSSRLITMFQLLYKHFGHQNWWPGDSQLEIAIGAILTQNTNWRNVEKSIHKLKEKGLLDLEKLLSLPERELAQYIMSSGYFNIKEARLRAFLLWLEKRGGFDALKNIATYTLREELLSIKGIGEETADSILLYALNRPVFVVDAYTKRIFKRHRIIEGNEKYKEIKEKIESAIPRDAALFNEYHALLVKLGKTFCRKIPQCRGCPLELE